MSSFKKKTTDSMFKHFILNSSSDLKSANIMSETFFRNPQAEMPLSICKRFQRVGLLVNFDDSYIMIMICGTWALKINILVVTLIMHKPLLVFEVCKFTRYAFSRKFCYFSYFKSVLGGKKGNEVENVCPLNFRYCRQWLYTVMNTLWYKNTWLFDFVL